MFWIVTKKSINKELKKIKEYFRKRNVETAREIQQTQQDIKDLKEIVISKKEADLMIREAVLKLRGDLRGRPQTAIQTPRTAKRKKADKILNKAEIMAEIGAVLKLGLSTEEMYQEVVNIKQLCRKTCFYKYLKVIREQTPQTTRTIETNQV